MRGKGGTGVQRQEHRDSEIENNPKERDKIS